jgi:hypothetical protein
MKTRSETKRIEIKQQTLEEERLQEEILLLQEQIVTKKLLITLHEVTNLQKELIKQHENNVNLMNEMTEDFTQKNPHLER